MAPVLKGSEAAMAVAHGLMDCRRKISNIELVYNEHTSKSTNPHAIATDMDRCDCCAESGSVEMVRIKTENPMLDVVPQNLKDTDARNDCTPSRSFPRLKVVFAWIASSCVDEWKGVPPADIMEHLEEPVMRPVSISDISQRQSVGLNNAQDMLADGSWIVPYALVADLRCAEGAARIIVNIHFRKEPFTENVFDFCQSYLAARIICEQTGVNFENNTCDGIASAYYVRLILNDAQAQLTETITESQDTWPSEAPSAHRDKLNVVTLGLPAQTACEPQDEPVVGLLELLFGVWHAPCQMEQWGSLLRDRYCMSAASFVSAQVDLLSFLTALMIDSGSISMSQMEDLDCAAQAIMESHKWTERADLLSEIHDGQVAADTLQAELRMKRAKMDACRDTLRARQVRRLVEGADDTEQAHLNAMLALVEEAYRLLNVQQEQVDRVRASVNRLQMIAREKGYMVENEEGYEGGCESGSARPGQVSVREAVAAPMQVRIGYNSVAAALEESRARRKITPHLEKPLPSNSGQDWTQLRICDSERHANACMRAQACARGKNRVRPLLEVPVTALHRVRGANA